MNYNFEQIKYDSKKKYDDCIYSCQEVNVDTNSLNESIVKKQKYEKAK
jgi:hypothetical protein